MLLLADDVRRNPFALDSVRNKNRLPILARDAFAAERDVFNLEFNRTHALKLMWKRLECRDNRQTSGKAVAALLRDGFSGLAHIIDGKEGLFAVFKHVQYKGEPATMKETVCVPVIERLNCTMQRMFSIGDAARLLAIACLLVPPNSFAEGQNEFARRYTVTTKAVQSLGAPQANEILDDGRLLFTGGAILPTTDRWEGAAWRACSDADGKVLWSARAEWQPNAASLFPLVTDGDSLWEAGVLKDGSFQVARFEAPSLRRIAALRLKFRPINEPAPYIAIYGGGRDADVQSSMVQITGDTIHVAVVSRDVRVLLDKLYQLPKGSRAVGAWKPGDAGLQRLPDHSGYYLYLRRPFRAGDDARPGMAILKLNNDGVVQWANSYAPDFPDFELGPRVTPDGSILIALAENILRGTRSWFIRIGPDGRVRWARVIEGDRLTVTMTDFSGGPAFYKFTKPYFFANGIQIVGSKAYSSILGLNYETGEIEKQVKISKPGAVGFIALTDDSLYASSLDSLKYPRADVSIYRFDFDLNLRAARSVRNAEPHWAWVHSLGPSGTLLFTYGYRDLKSVVTEVVNENFDHEKSCGVLDPLSVSCTKSNLQVKPITMVQSKIAGVTVTDAHSETTEGDLQLVPVEVAVTACDGSTSWLNSSPITTPSPTKLRKQHRRPVWRQPEFNR